VDLTTARFFQSTPNRGFRDVRRLLVSPGETRLSLHRLQEGVWRIADDFVAPGITSEVSVPLTASDILTVADVSSTGAATSLVDQTQSATSDAVGLWEWCRMAEPRLEELDQLPACCWGMYTEEQNQEIENAFQAKLCSVEIAVGIRTFEVVFDGHGRARQLDKKVSKRRFVRRRLLTSAEVQAARRSPAKKRIDSTDDCPICCSSFAETPTLPVVRTPCGHLFHGACVREIADRKDACPCCRAEVNWATTFRTR